MLFWVKDITQLFNEDFACLLTRGDMVKELSKTHCHFDDAFFGIFFGQPQIAETVDRV